MAFIPTDDTAEIVVKGLVNSQEMRNIFHIDFGQAVTEVLLQAAADLVAGWAHNAFVENLSNDASIYEVEARDVSEEFGLSQSSTADLPDAGEIPTDASPNNVAVCVTWLTGFTGRSRRGRTYVGAMPYDNFANSIVDPTRLASLLVDMINLVDLVNAEGWELVVNSLYTGGAPRVAGVNTPINECAANNYPDSQRRRLPGRGE